MLSMLTSHMHEKGHQIHFAYRHSDPYETGVSKNINPYIIAHPLKLNDVQYSKHRDLTTKLLYRLFKIIIIYGNHIYLLIKLTALLKKIQPDTVHVNNGGYPGALSCRIMVIASKIMKVNNVIMVVNNMPQRSSIIDSIYNIPIDFMVSRCTNKFITGSSAANSALKKKLGFKSTYFVIPNSISDCDVQMKQVYQNKYDITIGVIAQLIPRKGHIYLLKAISNLRDKGIIEKYNITVKLYGDGELYENILEYIVKHNLNDIVIMHGHIDNIKSILNTINIAVLPSIAHEDFPNSIIECFSFGIPVIGTDVAGIPEAIDNNINGIIVPVKDSQSLEEAIENMASDVELRKSMGFNALEKVKSHYVDSLIKEKYEKAYYINQ